MYHRVKLYNVLSFVTWMVFFQTSLTKVSFCTIFSSNNNFWKNVEIRNFSAIDRRRVQLTCRISLRKIRSVSNFSCNELSQTATIKLPDFRWTLFMPVFNQERTRFPDLASRNRRKGSRQVKDEPSRKFNRSRNEITRFGGGFYAFSSSFLRFGLDPGRQSRFSRQRASPKT